MKTYPSSQKTKAAMVAALKQLMQQKPVDKIAIREITDLCGMKRQNFYYHFEDIYDLLRWMYQEEAIDLLRRHEGATLWQDGLLQLFQYLQENREVCLCALKSLGSKHLRSFFSADIRTIFRDALDQLLEQNHFPAEQIDKEMTINFYVISLAGVLESWLLGEIDRTPEELIAFADTMLQDHIRGTALRLGIQPPHIQ